VALLLPACGWDGNFSILGYTTATNFDTHYKTIRVPVFANRTYYRDLEFNLTDLLVKEIEQRTPWKVVAGDADMEVTGTIMNFGKNVILVNPVNEGREIETIMLAEVSWRNLRTGEVLSKPPRRPGGPVLDVIPSVEDAQNQQLQTPPGLQRPVTTAPSPPGTGGALANMQNPSGPNGPLLPTTPLAQGLPARTPGIMIRSTATFLPELGESLVSAEYLACKRMARQIVNMMEKPW
jgi:hypothetical protein